MPDIQLAITFDDGPDGRPVTSNNTRKVLDVLAAPVPLSPIKAAFFIQTHVPTRLPSPTGRSMAVRAHEEGHLLAIHTGSLEDHVCHRRRVIYPADLPGTKNGLDSDMVRAIRAIAEVTGSPPAFVRATYGITDQACMETYLGRNLRHVHWDVPAEDHRPKDQIINDLKARTTSALADGKRRIVYLFHDINTVTGDNIREFIRTIHDAVTTAGHSPHFCSTRAELSALLTQKSGPGSNEECPRNQP